MHLYFKLPYIEIGGLVTKAGLDHLQTNTLYGALLTLAESLEINPQIKDAWTKIGKAKFDQEKQNKIAVIIKFEEQPDPNIYTSIKNHGLKWNKFKMEWYDEIIDIESLKAELMNVKYTIERI